MTNIQKSLICECKENNKVQSANLQEPPKLRMQKLRGYCSTNSTNKFFAKLYNSTCKFPLKGIKETLLEKPNIFFWSKAGWMKVLYLTKAVLHSKFALKVGYLEKARRLPDIQKKGQKQDLTHFSQFYSATLTRILKIWL